MKVILIGATGFVGSHLLTELLDRNVEVTAIARSANKITKKNGILKTANVDIFDTDILSEILKGNDAVISAYSPGWQSPNIANDTLKGYESIISCTKAAGVKRLQIVGGAGSLFIAPGKTIIDSGAIPSDYLPAVKALAQVLKELLPTEKELDWVFFSPAEHLVDGKRTGQYRLGLDDLIADEDGNSNISVEDYAKAMVDELESPKHHRQRFTIGY